MKHFAIKVKPIDLCFPVVLVVSNSKIKSDIFIYEQKIFSPQSVTSFAPYNSFKYFTLRVKLWFV